MRYGIILLSLVFTLNLGACAKEDVSQTLVTDVDHSAVKRQSIGNCWLYAQASWLESLYLTANQEEIDVSESYWTWWHWYDQIVGRDLDEIRTGGWWRTSAGIIIDHGFVLEGDFIPEEAGTEMSLRQAQAEEYINEQLAEGGALANRQDRTAENVRAQLDLAFGAQMAAAEELARSPEEVLVAKGTAGETTTLQAALAGNTEDRWESTSFPRIYGKNAVPSQWQIERRQALMQRVLKALNDHQPVVMTFMVDFNGLDITDQTFKASTLRENGKGSQGGHMVVLEDYVVDNVPGYGYIGEGDVSDEMKEAALQGDIVLLKAKNSWGTNRPDRGLTDGYNRFDWEYLTGQFEWDSGFGDTSYYYTTLTDFVLPPGY